MRVLGRVRLSRSTEESTSVERQREVIRRWADSEGHEVIGWAVDDGVSGSVDPFKTPEFGPWLTDPERIDSFDAIAVWKLDRLSRSSIHTHALFGWLEEHGKQLVSMTEDFDLGSWQGQMMAGLMSSIAKGELEQIRARQVASRRKLRENGRWPGGQFPFGYKPVVNPDGAGYVLAVDETAEATIREIVADVLDGRGVGYAVRRLNESGTLIPAEHRKSLRGKKPDRSKRWQQQTVRQILRSPSLLGHQTVRGQTIRDDSGDPVLIGEPLVSLDEFERLRALLTPTKGKPRTRVEPWPLAGVVVCYGCRRPLHHDRTVQHRTTKAGEPVSYTYDYLRHPAEAERGPDCTTTPIPEDYAAKLVEEVFLDDVGELEAVERVWVAGDSKDDQIRAAVAALDDLTAMIGTMSSETAKRRLQAQIAAKDAELAELEAAPRTEAHWEHRPLGQTYREIWHGASDSERRDLLLRSGITVGLRIDTGGDRRTKHEPGATYSAIHVPDDLRERLAARRS